MPKVKDDQHGQDVQFAISHDPDFVNLKKFDFSVEKVLDRYPDGAPVRLIAQGLMMTEAEVQAMLHQVVRKLRTALGVEVDDER